MAWKLRHTPDKSISKLLKLSSVGWESHLVSFPTPFYSLLCISHKNTSTHTHTQWHGRNIQNRLAPYSQLHGLSSSVETQRRQTLDPFMYQMLGAQASSTAGLLCVMRKSPTLSVYMNVQMIWGIICIQRSEPPCSEQNLFRWFVKKKQPAWGYRCNCYQ